MSNSKNYNSIVFLTTLSVYLGLVLIGAPPILAHAAMTRHFDVQNEIEVKDDLDKKPDDKELDNLNSSIEDYFKDVKSFVEDLGKLYQIEKFDTGYDEFALSQVGFTPCNVQGDPVHRAETSTKISNYWLQPAVNDASNNFENWDYLSDCFEDEKFDTRLSKSSGFKFHYDKSELTVEVSISKSSPQRAEQLTGKFNQALKIYEVGADEIIVKQIYKNTSFKSENNQVFIVTRLPRGSLDALIAQKDAQ